MIDTRAIATARARRARVALASGVLLLALTASCVMAAVLAARWSARFDVTATREHELSPRTRAVLDGLSVPLRLVVAADLAALDPDGWRRTLDVLTKFHGASDRFTVTTINTGSPEGLAQYDALLADLVAEHRPALDRHVAVITRAADHAAGAQTALSETSAALLTIRDDLAAATLSDQARDTLRRYFEGEAAKCRAFADDLTKAASDTRARLAQPPADFPVPPADSIARSLAQPLNQLASGLGVLGSSLDRFVRTEGVPPAAREHAETLLRALSPLRDRLARSGSELDSLPPLPIITVARTIQRSRAVLLVAPPPAESDPNPNRPSLSAIDPDAFLPPPTLRGSTVRAPDSRARAEELLTAGIASFSTQPRPLAVFVHGGPTRFGSTLGPWARVAARLGLRGIECLEWAAALDDQPPPAAVAARSSRPVVFIVFGMDVRRPEDAARLARVASAFRQLVQTGRNVLLCPAPSNLPASGERDPLVEPLSDLGLACDTGRLLMDERRAMGPTGAQRIILSGVELLEPGSAHPIAAALTGLRTTLPLAVMPLTIATDPPQGVTVAPVLTLPARPSLWAESEWLTFNQTPPEQRAALPTLPAPDSPRDLRLDSGSWLLAAAAERSSPAFPARQRAVVVGCLPWSFDVFADAQVAAEGRAGLDAPGNIELLQASVAWLAGREDLIARGAEAQALPTIPALSDSQRSLLRWALIGGLPLAVLLLGAAWRLARG